MLDCYVINGDSLNLLGFIWLLTGKSLTLFKKKKLATEL